MTFVKDHLLEIFEEIGLKSDSKHFQLIQNMSINEENIFKYLGELEQKIFLLITGYARLVAEEIKVEQSKKAKKQTDEQLLNEIKYQIADLCNIISNENAANTENLKNWTRKIDRHRPTNTG
jgi:galactokinase/mevalonate kinase-like predicted kinase